MANIETSSTPRESFIGTLGKKWDQQREKNRRFDQEFTQLREAMSDWNLETAIEHAANAREIFPNHALLNDYIPNLLHPLFHDEQALEKRVQTLPLEKAQRLLENASSLYDVGKIPDDFLRPFLHLADLVRQRQEFYDKNNGSMKGDPMKLTTAEHSPKEQLTASINAMQKIFGQDFTLVQKAAAEHGVHATTGNLSTPLSEYDYNQRLPDESNISTLETAETILIQCMDRRTSYAHAKEMGADVSLSMAGGAAQPENVREDRNPVESATIRRQTLVEFLSALYGMGNLKTITLSAHDGVCGGANYLTDGWAKKVHDQSVDAERGYMHGLLFDTYEALIAKGIPNTAITSVIAKVKEEHGHETYNGILPITF